jgi:hypothetical protein
VCDLKTARERPLKAAGRHTFSQGLAGASSEEVKATLVAYTFAR